MKLVIVLLSILIVSQVQARECASPAALEQAVAAMKSDLEGDLTDRANQVFNSLKAKVPALTYSQMQSNRRLDPVQAVQVEAVLAQELQRLAKSFDSGSECFREANDGARLGSIGWVCYGRDLKMKLVANDDGGSFSALLEKTGGADLQAPIVYRHQVLVSESYNAVETSNSFIEILFPGRGSHENGYSGMPVSDGISLENIDQLKADLTKANQSCD